MSAKPRPEVRKKPGPRLSRAVGVVRDEVRIGRRNWTLFGVAMGVIVVGVPLLTSAAAWLTTRSNVPLTRRTDT